MKKYSIALITTLLYFYLPMEAAKSKKINEEKPLSTKELAAQSKAQQKIAKWSQTLQKYNIFENSKDVQSYITNWLSVFVEGRHITKEFPALEHKFISLIEIMNTYLRFLKSTAEDKLQTLQHLKKNTLEEEKYINKAIQKPGLLSFPGKKTAYVVAVPLYDAFAKTTYEFLNGKIANLG